MDVDNFNAQNREINIDIINNKVFCIGLHKTGTSTLYEVFLEYGFKGIHSANWDSSIIKLKAFDAFSDGGGHFTGMGEFDFPYLATTFPNAKFILQTRDTKSWIISKLKHAGWTEDTELLPDDPKKNRNEDWRYKSLLTIRKFIEQKYLYEHKVISFFEGDEFKNRLIVIDIIDKSTQEREFQRLVDYLKLQSVSEIRLPHANKQLKKKVGVSEYIEIFIETEIKRIESRKDLYFAKRI